MQTTPDTGPADFRQRIMKPPPFKLEAFTHEFPPFTNLLTQGIDQLDGLPDFSDDSKIAVISDFGGEHKDARFNTYSFLLMAYNKVGPFETKVRELRNHYGLLAPYSEFAFKDLSFGPRSRALADFLQIVDNFIHGVLVTVAIEKRIGTVFGKHRKDAHRSIEEQLVALDLGQWKGGTAEKMLRVSHAIAVFTALTTHEGQRLLWYCDYDAINEDGKKRHFEHTQQIFGRVLGMYCKHKFDILGFGKSFKEKSHLDDLLSVSDFAAGAVQDLLQAHESGGAEISGGKEKEALFRWVATQARYLSKVVIQVVQLPNGELGSGLVHLDPIPPRIPPSSS
jgi:hypothetical protein